MFCWEGRDKSFVYKMGDFGVHQKLIDKHGGVFNEMYLLTGVNQGRKSFLMILEVGKNSDTRIRIHFEKNNSPMRSIFKSIVNCEIEKGSTTDKMEKHLDELEYDALCSQWLYTLLFIKKYSFRKLTLTLPPRHQTKSIERCVYHDNQIKEMQINVAKDEQDLGVVNWWLTRFQKPVYYLQIVSNAKIQLTPNIMFKESEFVEICGQSNVSVEFIKTLQGQYFMHRAMNKQQNFTDDQFKEIANHLHSIDRFQKLHFKQECNHYPPYAIKTWLQDTYPGAHRGINFFDIHETRSILFHFKKTRTSVTLGNIKDVDDVQDPKTWLNLLRSDDAMPNFFVLH